MDRVRLIIGQPRAVWVRADESKIVVIFSSKVVCAAFK